MRWLIFALLLAACAAQPVGRSATPLPSGPMISFPTLPGDAPQRPNAQIAQDFLDLEFHLESGESLDRLTRFEGPITLAITGPVPPGALQDIEALRLRLAREAGLTLTPTTGPANITLAFEPKAALRRTEPLAACFVAPNVTTLAEYRRARGTERLEWEPLARREQVAIFLPADSTPQDLRDCLHEELAQALGPLNDLYRLPDSVFNDDNFQSTLTGFDVLMLRLHYAPELTSGMTEAQVAARLPGLLARYNPRGQVPGQWADPATPRPWITAIERAMNPRPGGSARLTAALQALSLAQAAGWNDNRMGFTLFTLGRLLAQSDPPAAARAFAAAGQIYASLPDGGIHLAHVQMQMAAFALAGGQYDAAIRLADQGLPLAERAQNAALMANLMLVKSYALQGLGRDTEAQALRLDTLPAARYGFGREQDIRARQASFAALLPDKPAP